MISSTLIRTTWPAGWAGWSWRTGLLLVGLAVLTEAVWNPPLRPDITNQPNVAGAPRATPASSAAGVEHQAVITEQPLFHANRRPWSPPPPEPRPAVAAPPPPPPQAPPRQPFGNYVLTGTMTSGNERIAILRPPSGSRAVILREGQSVDGWVLRSIGENRVQFESGSRTHELAIPSRRPPGRSG